MAANDYCAQCDHCNQHKDVTARLGTWNDALNALKNAKLPANEEEAPFTVQDVFMLAAFLDGVTASE